ncbi:MAG TPA: hypothetical protein VN688_13310 [Gemmataceae bacterium]|nr:hypothetical protein [Gemmataceae bacterium]
MSLKGKALGLCKRLGAPAKFAAKLALGAMLPGSPAVVELVCGVLDCVHETAKDTLEFDAAKMRAASAADLQRVEQVRLLGSHYSVAGSDVCATGEYAERDSSPISRATVWQTRTCRQRPHFFQLLFWCQN